MRMTHRWHSHPNWTENKLFHLLFWMHVSILTCSCSSNIRWAPNVSNTLTFEKFWT
jgi:hypothetical protein